MLYSPINVLLLKEVGDSWPGDGRANDRPVQVLGGVVHGLGDSDLGVVGDGLRGFGALVLVEERGVGLLVVEGWLRDEAVLGGEVQYLRLLLCLLHNVRLLLLLAV